MLAILVTFPLLALIAAPVAATAGESGPIAHYRFDEGKGAKLLDSSGNGHRGVVHGAAWVPSGEGFALRFDGVDDYVDCGGDAALSPTHAVSLEAWVHPTATPGAGEAGIVGKRYASYVLTYYTDGRVWWYISGGGSNCKAVVPAGAWHHVVGTFDGKGLRLYVDGRLAASAEAKRGLVGTAGQFRMGNSSGDKQFTKGAHFQGMLDEVRLYGRALAADEVARHYRTTRLTHEIELRPHRYVFSGTLVVQMNVRGLGKLPAGARALVELARKGMPSTLPAREIHPLPSSGEAVATLEVGDLAPGEYELLARATTPEGKPIGKVARCPLAWPERPRWKDAPEAKVLNNLVAELLNVSSPARRGRAKYRFVSPRDGWVFIASTAQAAAAFPVSLALDGKPLHTHRTPGTLEAMRVLPAGSHTLTAGPRGGYVKVVVRAIPELVFAKYGAHPHVREYGKYDWAFLEKHVLANINVMVGTGARHEKPFAREWRRQGRRWLVECGVPGLRGRETVSADEAERYWSRRPGMADPLFDGLIADEFAGGDSPKYAAWTEAVRRIRANPKLKGKLFTPYCAPMHGARASREFIQAVMQAGWRFAFERYLPEPRGEAAARAYLDSVLRQAIASWEQAMPGARERLIVCIGTFSQPPESLDVDPAVNHKAFLDMQLNLLANAPDCFGLAGVMTYLCSYTDEETVRWMGKLFRHYCIEGKSRPLCKDPYALPHLRNGDFEDGLNGWAVRAAEAGSVAARRRSGFSWLQGRYPRTSQGDTVLWMTRSRRRPNVVSQAIKALVPGRLYTLRMYSGDFRDLSRKQTHAISIELTNAAVLTDRSFQHLFRNCYSHHHGPFDRQRRAWMNYHWILFRAKGEKATLAISDWTGDDKPGGPTGQELMMNFIQVQPYEQ